MKFPEIYLFTANTKLMTKVAHDVVTKCNGYISKSHLSSIILKKNNVLEQLVCANLDLMDLLLSANLQFAETN